jgi:hypothetical protein
VSPASAQPIGLAPSAPPLLRARRALAEHRLQDAGDALRRFTPQVPLDRAWAALLRAELAVARRALEEAERNAWEAGIWAAAALQAEPADAGATAQRLWAFTLETIGRVLRRRDRIADALAVHEQAYAAAGRASAVDQQCESAVSLALCAEHADQSATAIEWSETALRHATALGEAAHPRTAEIHTHLARRHAGDGNHAAALAAAQRALALRLQTDPTSIAAARARLLVGEMLLSEGMSLLEAGTPDAQAALSLAAGRLGEAHEELAAFGSPARFDALWCRDQMDTARRLAALE